MRGVRAIVTGIALAATVALHVAPASAESASDTPASAPLDRPFPRARASFGGLAGGNTFYGGNHKGNVDVVGAYFLVGLQATPGLGTEVEVAAGTSGFTSDVHGALFLDFVLAHAFALAVGPVIGESYGSSLVLDPCPEPPVGGEAPCQLPTGSPTTYVAGAARIDFFLSQGVDSRSVSRALDFGLELQVGSAASRVPGNESSGGLGGYFTIGYALN